MEHNHMIEALATNGSNHPLYIGSLPRRARCRQNFTDAHVSHLFSEISRFSRGTVSSGMGMELQVLRGKCPDLAFVCVTATSGQRKMKACLDGHQALPQEITIRQRFAFDRTNLEADLCPDLQDPRC